jgi:hypothetical protein
VLRGSCSVTENVRHASIERLELATLPNQSAPARPEVDRTNAIEHVEQLRIDVLHMAESRGNIELLTHADGMRFAPS